MKISSRLGWLVACGLIFTGLLILAMAKMAEKTGKEGWFLLGIGVFLATALTIKAVWPKTSSRGARRHTSSARTPTNPGLCATGIKLKMAARLEKGLGRFSLQWDVHKKNCPVCQKIGG